jgi:hypothetical protein
VFHFDQNKVAEAGKIREFSQLCLFVFVIVQETTLKVLHQEVLEGRLQVWRSAAALNVHGQAPGYACRYAPVASE